MRHVNHPDRSAQEEGVKLGLSRALVLSPNFGHHTIRAIRVEMEKGASLTDAFQKYCLLNHIEIGAMTELGLSRRQVLLVENFGEHTIRAINAEIAKGISLDDAFAKYRGLKNFAIEGMTELGLNREQVLEPDFGYHTVNAIKSIIKRTKELSSSEAFEMVKGKSAYETGEYLKVYLEATKKAHKPLTDMVLIRVIVNKGGGFGHQRAAITLMQKLREMGFKGVFDIQCEDQLGAVLINAETRKEYMNHEPIVSRQLKYMIPEFESSTPNEEGVRLVAGLGAIKISSLPHDYDRGGDLRLSEADLAVCAADDWPILTIKNKPNILFNSTAYIGLEPTDWHRGSCFIIDGDDIVTELPKASTMRLSSEAAYRLPDISSISLTVTERRILDLTSHIEINSQLVYGLFHDRCFDRDTGRMGESGKLGLDTEMHRIIEANMLLGQKTGKPAILLLPQPIALDEAFIRVIKSRNAKIHFVDLTTGDLDISTYRAGDVIVAHTGRLQHAVFDHLMLRGTTLPPVIEGCNSRELCESAGRPFIHGASKYVPLKQYEIKARDKQELHTQASRCLQLGDPRDVPQLAQYMEESLTSNPELMAYAQQRRAAFFKRPDACEVAFDALGMKYEIDRKSKFLRFKYDIAEEVLKGLDEGPVILKPLGAKG